MRRVWSWRRNAQALPAVILFLAVAPAQVVTAASPAANTPASPPVLVKQVNYEISLDQNGLSTNTVHVRLQAANAAAAGTIGQQPVHYAASLEDLEVVEAYTLKPDGRKIPVEASSIYEQPAPGAPQMPMFDDQRQKVIVFPNVEAGDSVDFTYRKHDKAALMPGQFTLALPFSRLVAYGDVEVTIVAPKTYPLVVATHEMAFDRHQTSSAVTYHWHYSAPVPLAEESHLVSPFSRTPRLLVSSFADYDALGHTYAALAAPETEVTPKIQAMADQITRGAIGHRAQAQAIYNWVSRHVRYVAVEIGAGSIIPHGADTILANGYGDCKDHAALFSALLKAKGIASQLVLINYGDEYELPDATVIGAFNHVILWLPELELYADTTSGVAPFGVLSFQEYGKPVIRVASSGPVVARTPILPPGIATESVKTTVRIDDQGRLTGENTMTGTGPFAVMLRGIGLAIQSVGPDRAVTAMLQRAGIPGSGSFIVPSPDNLDSNFVVTASFALGPFSDVLEGRPFSVPTGLTLLGSPGNSLMGPLTERKISDTEPTTCYSGTQEEDISVEAPKGRRFIALPHDTSVATSNIKFLIHWTGDGQTIKVHREFSSNVATALCSGDVRKDTAKALTEIMNGYSDGLTLSKELSAADQKLADMLSDGAEAIKKSDYEDAVRIFTNALAWNELPAKAAPYMHLGRAQAYVGEAKFDLAIADCEEAVKLDSSLASGYPTLARALAGQREFRRSEQVWTTAITLNPKSAYLYDSRGILRDDLGDHAGAVADFNQAIALAQPTDKIARYYFDLGVSYWLVHDWATAIADDSEAIRHDANFVAAYLGRARSEYFAGKLDAAIADLTTALQLDSRDMYGSLWLYIAEARAGKDAKGDLARRTQGVDLSEWPGPLIRVLRGDLKPNEVTLPVHNAAWQTKRDQCEEDFYEAEMFLLSGDKTSAVTLFRAAVDTGVVEYYEYLAATVELERLTH